MTPPRRLHCNPSWQPWANRDRSASASAENSNSEESHYGTVGNASKDNDHLSRILNFPSPSTPRTPENNTHLDRTRHRLSDEPQDSPSPSTTIRRMELQLADNEGNITGVIREATPRKSLNFFRDWSSK